MRDPARILREVIRPGLTRGLDFVIIDELRKRTGISPNQALKFALAELLCNALDKMDASEISVDLQVEDQFFVLSVSDNGSRKLTEKKEVSLIFDFQNKGSSKRGILMVSRGYLGNALKCILGYTYALAERKGLHPPPLIVRSGGREYIVTVKVDGIMEVAEPHVEEREREDDGLTTFIVKLPRGLGEDIEALKEVIHAASMVNPRRKIKYNILGDKGTLGSSEDFRPLEKQTAIQWYTYKQFEDLFRDFVKAKPEAKLREFISIFRGFAHERTPREVIKELNERARATEMYRSARAAIMITKDEEESNLVARALYPSTPLRDVPLHALPHLLAVIKNRAKPITKRNVWRSILRSVGKDSFERLRVQNGWESLKYVRMTGIRVKCTAPAYLHGENRCCKLDHVEFPFLVEVAVFDRKDDSEGLKVYQCVNFMASMEDIFGDLFDISYRLGRVGITEETPVTIVVHLVCPVLRWLNYGKTALGDASEAYMYRWGDSLSRMLERAFNKVLPIPKVPRIYRPPPPKRPLSWVPHGRLGNPLYEERLKDFAREILVIDAQRSKRVEKLSSRGWCYVIEGFGKIQKGEFDACQKAINDCRKIGLLPIDFVAEDQDITRRFQGIHEALDPAVLLERLKGNIEEMLRDIPSCMTDYWEGEKYYVMMCVEKGDILNLFKPICEKYHVPIVNSKGWYPILLRYYIAMLSMKAEERGLIPVLLLFYDHDIAGLKITDTFRKGLWDIYRATGWDPSGLIIERFGLNFEDIERYNLTWIENLKSSSGRDPDWSRRDVQEYVRRFGVRKCESNALFRNDETLRAGEEICRRAIERYYGEDALERFKKKEERSKAKLKVLYEDPIWKDFYRRIDELINILKVGEEQSKRERHPTPPSPEEEVEVKIDRGYGVCPRCGRSFSYDEEDIGRLVRCRFCNLPMRLRWREAEDRKNGEC